MTKYTLDITRNGETETSAFGSVGLVSYAAKAAEFASDENYAVNLGKVGADGTVETITSLTADGDTVSDVLKSKLARARKAEKGAAGAEDSAEAGE